MKFIDFMILFLTIGSPLFFLQSPTSKRPSPIPSSSQLRRISSGSDISPLVTNCSSNPSNPFNNSETVLPTVKRCPQNLQVPTHGQSIGGSEWTIVKSNREKTTERKHASGRGHQRGGRQGRDGYYRSKSDQSGQLKPNENRQKKGNFSEGDQYRGGARGRGGYRGGRGRGSGGGSSGGQSNRGHSRK